MRIAIWHNLPSGGGKRALHDQVRGLVARGHQVEICCPPTANRGFLPLADHALEHILPLDVATSSTRAPIFRRTFADRSRLMAAIDAMDRHCQACAAEINRGGFDVLLAHASTEFHPTPIGRHVTIPAAIYLQEPNRGFYEAMPRLPWVAIAACNGRPKLRYYKDWLVNLIEVQSRRIQIREELASASGFDLILVNSLFSRESMLRAYGLESRVCYLGIDTDLFQPSDEPKLGYVVGLGNIAPNKRPDLAIEALGTIEEHARPELIWVGNTASDSYLDSLQEQARRLGVKFKSLVNVSNVELIATLARAAVLIYTSRLEPFGYAPLEANACGTAVVAVAEGGIRETVFDGLNGTLIAEGDPVALGRAVRDYCTNPEVARAVGLAGRKNVEQVWSLEAALDRLERQLVKLAPAASSPSRT